MRESVSRCSRPKAGEEAYERRAGGRGGGGGRDGEKNSSRNGGTQGVGGAGATAERRLLSSLGRPVK